MATWVAPTPWEAEVTSFGFRRGLATNLHDCVKDKDIQAILRHSTLALTMNIYVKSVVESQVNAMDSLSEKFEICNDHATGRLN